MNLEKEELLLEENYLKDCINTIREKISELGGELYTDQEKSLEFKKFIWDNKASLDPQELKALMSDNDLEIYLMQQKGKYFQKLYKIQNNPYFGSIIFDCDGKKDLIYIGITHLEKDDEYLIHDWRSPICSLFYDFEEGNCFYIAPEGKISGNLDRKRQYKIKDGKLLHVFDNNLNIDDELLQEVFASESSDKMKNIVNTIQQEQNKIIRNTEDKNLIVQGIAGSGKTSVALHRIAFLLYKIENLSANNVLIFSPNNIFTEYISNVLPELGEDNTLQTTFHDFLSSYITEYKTVESFIDFIGRFYKYEESNPELVKYKQSDEIIKDFTNYLDDLVKNVRFQNEITDNLLYHYTKDELNYLLHERYNKYPLFERIKFMALKFSENNYNGKKTHVKSFNKMLYDSLNIKKDYKKIYGDFFRSNFSKIRLTDSEIKAFINKKIMNFEDANLFVYMKGYLEEYPYNGLIKQVVIDEAQDYTKLEYIILKNIFKKSSFTILGDINQTINPYYKYNSLYELNDIFSGSTRYLELTKTYRSTKEIIDYTNKILNLNHVSAIRRENTKDVQIKKYEDLSIKLINDIKNLQNTYKSTAIITKDEIEAEKIYIKLKDEIDISLVVSSTAKFKKNLIIIPAYIAKGLEFDSVIILDNPNNRFKEKYLYYVACTRAQHELLIYK